MSSYAVTLDAAPADRRAKPRRGARSRASVQWNIIAPSQVGALRPTSPRGKKSWLVALVLLAIALHVGVVWYVRHAKPDVRVAAVRHELAVELVRPPKPPEPPKIEEPKPQPRKEPVRVLPQIQTAAPVPSTVQEAAPSEPPVAVAPVASAPPAPPAELPVTEPIGRAGYLNNPPPDYPAAAVRQHWEGTVVLRVRVLSDGHVDTIEVRESSGRRVLDEQAMRTVKAWVFTPSKRGGTPIDGWATVPIEFRLDS